MIFKNGHSIKIAQDRCLNRRHPAIECDHCIKNCPSDAILKNEREEIILDEEHCNGCGLCFNICPTEVFHSEHWDETTIFATVEDNGWQITEFFCGKHDAPFRKKTDVESGGIRVPACLGALSKGAWYEIGLKTKIELHLEECSDCPFKEVINILKANLSIVLEWLEASGHCAEISIIEENLKGVKKRNLLAVDSGLKVTSRRDFFLSMFAGGKAKEEIKIILGTNTTNHYTFGENESLLPSWQKRLAQVYSKNAIEGHGQPAYWPSIEKNQNCVNCGLCSQLCPTKTLQVEIDGKNYIHSFTSGLCIDCRICQLYCPNESIIREREKIDKPFKAIKLSSVSVGACLKCSNVTTTNKDKLCYWCQENSKNEEKVLNNCRELFLR